jgi:teichuronic acid biosynthesis glycosyltransferase TuaG
MNSFPEVSVIMPVFNAEIYLKDTLNSLIAQTFLNWELLAVDDKSRDKSLEILKEFEKADSRIKIISKENNSGSAETRNLAIQLAKGRYISFLDADDLWDANFLEEMIKFMKKNNSSFSFCSYRIVNDDNIEITNPFIVKEKKYSLLEMLIFNRVGLLTAIYDTKILDKMYFDTSLKSLRDDYALWLDIFRKTSFNYANSKILASYRVRENALTSNKKRVIISHYKMLRNHFKLNPLSAFIFTLSHSLNGLNKYLFKKI